MGTVARGIANSVKCRKHATLLLLKTQEYYRIMREHYKKAFPEYYAQTGFVPFRVPCIRQCRPNNARSSVMTQVCMDCVQKFTSTGYLGDSDDLDDEHDYTKDAPKAVEGESKHDP